MGSQVLWIGCVAAVLYILLRSIHRLYFHPLAKFPGPKLAALTHAYEFYYDGVKGGKFIWEIQRMHEHYGPIVRINPRELHIKDPYYFDKIYQTKRQEKDPYMVRIFTIPLSTAAAVDHDRHRFLRQLVNPLFSKRAVASLEHIIQDKVDKVVGRLTRAARQVGTVVSLDGLFAALTADAISHYTFGESMGILDTPDLRNDFRDAVTGAGVLCHFSRFFGVLQMLLETVPGWIEWLQPSATGLFDTKRMIESKAQAAINGEKTASGFGTIFDTLCDPSLPPEERTLPRVRDEALVMLGAGTETTARVLAVGSFHLYRDRTLLQKLRDELVQVMPEPTTQVPLSRLEQLPYLTAVINESLRMSHSVSIRLPRISPTTALQYEGFSIPPGTPVSHIQYFVHMDPTIFPNPDTFDPERWIDAKNQGERLTRFLVPFSKGPRICLGLNLAYSELYQMFSVLVRRFDLEIYQTTPESIRITRDLMIGLPDEDALRVNARVTGVI